MPSPRPPMSDPEPGIDRRAFLRRTAALAAAGTLGPAVAAARAGDSPQQEADAFLARYVEGWLPKETASSEAAWTAATDVTEEHTQQQIAKTLELNRFVGDPEVIETVQRLLKQREKLDELTVRQLEEVRLRAAESPGTLPEVVAARAEAEARQSAAQDGFTYVLKVEGQPDRTLNANDIDRVLVESRDLDERRRIWELSKTIGAPLRDGLLRLRDLRNKVARELGFDDFFALQVADYGLTVPEMMALCDEFVAQVKPLYEQLHTWAKHELARRYKADAPGGPIPAHWLSNRWGQNWPGLVEGVDMDAPFAGKPAAFITEQAERFYVALGFPRLPRSFWEKSDLYPVPPGQDRKKNSHASAWHIDLRDDVRSLMSIEPDSRWFTTAHHELGHIYYYISYSTPKVPYLLRGGANRAFHEGIGDLIGLAASQRPYLKQVGLLTPEAERAEPELFLLDAALDGASVVFLPWSAGVMTHFERDFYAGKVSDDALNAAWWQLVGQYQGIAPPGARPETLCDPATKTHINDDPAQYYDYAIGTVLKFQLHDHIAREILKQDPRDCNYYDNKQVGTFLRDILSLGATRDWNAVLREATGSGLSARPLVAYFEPLMGWLERRNAGRKIGWG
jgi:peptidyl-dipeptidase A